MQMTDDTNLDEEILEDEFEDEDELEELYEFDPPIKDVIYD